MKKLIIASALTVFCASLYAQTEFDALKISQTEINGTARYTGLAGAFGALGADVSAIKDNPAGLGVFRKSEITATVDVLMQNNLSVWNNKSTNSDLFKYGFNNFSFVIASPTWRVESGNSGLQSSNFSFSYNKLKNFNRNLNIRSNNAPSTMTDYMAKFTNNNYGYYTGSLSSYYLDPSMYPMGAADNPYQNVDIPWMSIMAANAGLIYEVIDTVANVTTEWTPLLYTNDKATASYVLREQGSVDEYSFGWSGNFSNRFYFGATVNLQSIYYRADSKYHEDFEDVNENYFGQMTLDNTLIMKGTGLNLNLGAIFVPVDFIRFGLALHTPMFYNLSMTNYADLSSSQSNNVEQSPENTLKYMQQSPLQLNVSTAFILENKGLISAEYVFNNYKGMRLMDEEGDSQAYIDENTGMNDMLNNSRTIKIGGEYKLTNNFALRAGFANTSSSTKNNAQKWFIPSTTRTDPEYFIHHKTDYFTLGFGYREAGWYIDMAYMNKLTNETYYAYNSTYLDDEFKVNPASVKTTNNNLVVTVGLRF